MRDGWRLALGMLTVAPAPMPRRVGTAEARAAMLLAPLAVLPLGLAVLAVGLLGVLLAQPPLLVGLLAVAALVLGNRAFHVDGLSDTADGLTASHDRARSLAAMHTSTSGPAGGAAVVLVLGVQAVGFAALVALGWRGSVLAGVVVCCSRLALWIACARGVPAAVDGGLGGPYASTVARPLAALSWVSAALLLVLLGWWAGLEPWRGALAAALAVAVVVLLVRRAVARLGGTNGDVYGASIELTLAALLVGLA